MLGDGAVGQHDDLIDAVDGGDAVGDDEGGAAAHEFLEGLHDRGLGGGIEGAGRFVEDEDRGVLQKRAGDADALALADAEMAAAFADLRAVAVGHGGDEVVGLGALGGFDDLLLSGVGSAVGDVFADGGGEQQGVLQDDADVVAQRFLGERADVVAVERDAACAGIVEARDEGKQGAFAGARVADEGDGFAGVEPEIDVAKNGVRVVVAEGDVFEDDLPARLAQRGGFERVGELDVVLLIEDLRSSVYAGGRGLERPGYLAAASSGW